MTTYDKDFATVRYVRVFESFKIFYENYYTVCHIWKSMEGPPRGIDFFVENFFREKFSWSKNFLVEKIIPADEYNERVLKFWPQFVCSNAPYLDKISKILSR